MFEKQFIQFSEERPEQQCGSIGLPIPFTTAVGALVEVYQSQEFFYAYSANDAYLGDVAVSVASSARDFQTWILRLDFTRLADKIKPGEAFYLKSTDDEGEAPMYSQLLCRMDASKSVVRYEDTSEKITESGTGGTVNTDFSCTKSGDVTVKLETPDIEHTAVNFVQIGGQRVSFESKVFGEATYITFKADEGDEVLINWWFSGGRYAFFYAKKVVEYVEDLKQYTFLEYKCNEPAFGFAFSGKVGVWLPILRTAPQYSQSDKTYTKLDGGVVTLFSQARKEWDCETEYLPEEWHDKIMVALMCDEVYMDGERVFKSSQYEVDWEAYDTLDDGTKIAKASFNVQSNMVSRNSNY